MDLLPRIEIDGASKTIGNSVVLDQIQLTVKPGEMIGLQGVNGSGKTMLLRLISGLIYPTKGHVLIDGKMLGSDLEFPPSIGFLIENPTFLLTDALVSSSNDAHCSNRKRIAACWPP